MKSKRKDINLAEKGDNDNPELSDRSIEFLFIEYNTLRDMLTQCESGIQGLFNFYLTILSAIIGAIIILLQAFGTIKYEILGGLLIFEILIGIFYQWAIVGKYADLIHFSRAINELRGFILDRFPDAKPPLYEMPTYELPTKRSPSRWDRWEARLWFVFPIQLHQLFISFVNSVFISALVWMLANSFVKPDIAKTTVATFVVFWLSSIANNTYAKLKLNNKLSTGYHKTLREKY